MICPLLMSQVPSDRGAEQPKNRVKRNGAVSGRGKKTMEQSGGYRIRLERKAAHTGVRGSTASYPILLCPWPRLPPPDLPPFTDRRSTANGRSDAHNSPCQPAYGAWLIRPVPRD